MPDKELSQVGGQFRPAPQAIGITKAGLVYDGETVLVRMQSDAFGRQNLALGPDRGRLLAMLSIAYRQPVVASEVVGKVEAAANLWTRGDKALANLRLMYADLAGPIGDPTAGPRVALAAHLLDNGWSPAALLAELGLSDRRDGLGKNNPNHVPAGHGDRSGQFDFKFGSSSAPNGRIVVAGGESDEEYEARHLLGGGDPKERAQHHQAPIDLAPPVPVMGGALVGQNTSSAVSAAARAAAEKVGPGKGPVYGTKVHTELKAQIKRLGREDLHPEESYLNQKRVDYGTPGSVRVDAAQGSRERPDRVYDLKTGGASLTPSRTKQLQSHLPLREDGTEVPIHEIRP